MKPSDLKKEFAEILKVKTVISVDYTKIEYMIDKVFRNERHKEGYELPCLEERGSGNGEEWEVGIVPAGLDHDTARDIHNGEWPHYSTRELLCEMCRRGLIPSGDYLISISW